MSFDADVAKDAKYHQADVEMVSDPRNWPRPKKQQKTQEVDETTEVETTAEVVENNDDAEDKIN
ncbi:MAG: hypothetical protein IJB90_04495 [Clostridia bacterium]|nr:hypothetical protein [Clostridia bacterium]